MTTNIKDLVAMPEAARLTGLSQQTLRRWVKDGKVAGVNIGGRLWCLDRADLERASAHREAPKISA